MFAQCNSALPFDLLGKFADRQAVHAHKDFFYRLAHNVLRTKPTQSLHGPVYFENTVRCLIPYE